MQLREPTGRRSRRASSMWVPLLVLSTAIIRFNGFMMEFMVLMPSQFGVKGTTLLRIDIQMGGICWPFFGGGFPTHPLPPLKKI